MMEGIGSQHRSVDPLPVSVVMCAFNAERYLRDAATSILNQTHKELELLVIDDGSTDSTQSIVESLMNEDARVKSISLPENKGTAFARQIGLERASNEWMAFFDADDVALPNMLEEEVKAITEDPTILVAGSYAYHVGPDFTADWNSPTGTDSAKGIGTIMKLGPTSKAEFDRLFSMEKLVLLFAPALFSRRHALEAGGYRQSGFEKCLGVRLQDLMEDIDLWCRMAEFRKDEEYIVVLPKPLFCRRKVPTGLTSTYVIQTQRKGRWLKDALWRRRQSLSERSLEELEASCSRLQRLNYARRDRASLWYTRATNAYVQRMILTALVELLIAGALSPSYLIKRLKAIGGKSASLFFRH